MLDIFLEVTRSDCGFVGTAHRLEKASYTLHLQAVSSRKGCRAAIDSMADWCAKGLRHPVPDAAGSDLRFSGEPMVVNNPGDIFASDRLQAQHGSLSSFMALPVHSGGELVGLVGVALLDNSYSEDSVEFLRPLLKLCGGTFDEKTRPGHIAGISEQELLEEKLRSKDLVLEQILHQLPVGVFCKDINDDFRYTMYNRKCEELFGTVAENPLGKTDFEFLPDDMAHQYRKQDIEIIRAGEIFHDPDQRIESRDGEISYVQILKTCVHDSNGEPSLIVGTAEDITRQRQFEHDLRLSRDEAQQANEAKSDFLSRMSHELRTPLNAILGFGQLLEMRNENLTETQREGIAQILASGGHLLDLIEDVLDFSRIESGHMTLNLERVSSNEVLRRCVSMVEAFAESNGIRMNFPSGDIPDVVADSRRLQQVLVNLMTNAIKYNKPEGTVEILITRQSDSTVRIKIADTGLGISAEDQLRLFEPFERLGKTNITVEGTGIGLSICKKLTEMMGGEIGFESDLGVGSAFWIDLHGADSSMAIESRGSGANFMRQAVSLKGIRILYVEDHLASIKLMSEIVQKIPKCDFKVATNALDGVALARSAAPDLILMDINLPGLQGFDAFEMLQNDERTRNIPVIALSATADEASIERARLAGFKDFLCKPLYLDQLFRAIGSVYS